MDNYLYLHECTRHGTYFMPFAFYRCSIPDTFTVLATHWHEEMEIAMIREGTCFYNIDLNTYEVHKGDLILIPPQVLHGVSQTERADSMVSDSIVFSFYMLGCQYPDFCTTKYLQPLAGQKWTHPLIISPRDSNYRELAESFWKIQNCYLQKEQAYELNLKSLLFHFFYLLFQDSAVSCDFTPDNTEITEKIKIVLLYMQEHYQNHISVSELAGLCHFSDYHFMRFFKKHVNMTCVEYLNYYRLTRTLGQLAGSEMPVTDIAFGNGFNNISYFNRQFRKYFGMTPKEYRSLQKK